MKKYNKLFAILFAVLGVTTLKAQTDVTDQYLVNADFEGSYESVYEIKNDGRYIYKPEGWTVDYVNKSTWNMTVVGSTDTNAASTFKDTYAIPADNNRYMVRFRDNQPTEYVDLSQTITIKESGSYTFSADLIREDGSKVDVSLYVGETSVSNASPGVWENRSFTIALSAGDVVKVGLKFRNIAAGGNKLGADNVKIAFEPINTSEQSWIAPIVGVNLADVTSDTELYMYNVKADAFASSGMSWGTHAIVKELQNGDSKLSADVHRCRVSKPTDGQLQIMLNEKSFLGGGGPTSTNDCWVDHGSNNIYIYNEVSTNVYTLKPTTATTDSYLDCSWKYGGHITFSATNGYGNTEWAFVLRSDITSGKYLLYKAKKEMYDIYAAVKEAGHDDTYAEALAIANVAYNDANATAATVNAATKVLLANVAPALTSDYFSANSLFKNPDMRGYGDDTDWGNGLNAFGDGIFESWHSSETITQKQTGLPNGFYTVEFIGIYRQDGGDAAPTLTLTSGSNSAKANLKALTEIDFGNCSGGNKWTGANKPDDKYTAGEALAHTDANVKVENFFVENGELTVTVAMPSGSQWLLCQGFRISYKAESLEQYANLFYAAKSAAEAIDQNTLNIYAKNTLTTALNNAATEQIDKAWYQEHTAALNNAVTIANDIATTYPKTSALLTICNDILDNSVEFEDGAKETFSGIVSTASENVAIAQTSAAINDIYNTLEAARQTYVVKADPINDTYFDYTFLMTNPEVSTESHWTNGRYNTGQQYTGAPDNRYLDSWNGASQDIYQAVEELPNGYYTVKAAGRASTACTSAYIYLNDTKVEIDKAGSTGNDLGNGWKWYTTEKTIVDGVGTAKIGFACNSTEGQWAGADDFHFYYYGYDVASAQNTVTYLKSGIEGRRSSKMSSAVREQMETAYNNADASKTTRKELEPMIAALRTAIDAVDVSIAEYEKILGYINMTKVFTDVTTYETKYNDGEYTTEDVEPVRQELNVLRFKAASEIFPNNIEVTGWEGSMGGKNTSDQHWDGTTGENATKYYDNNSWGGSAHSTQTNITLPAGSYVLKAALRSNANTTLKLTVLDKTVDVEGKGDQGYGITINGWASFSPDSTYANNNAGRGWEWEFVKFELEETTTVTLKVECNYNGVYGWASFSDITLWMDDETYMTVYGHAINEPLANAKSLVDTKPMGAAENDALKAAIALGENVSTAQELTKAIEDLNTAVDKAKAWVVTYNEKKEPLVAALDRFETDYNDGANGCLYHLQKAAWSTVIEKVQAAAEAKDVTDSYDGFEAATTDLVSALDAAQASINMYAKLKAEIAYAQAYTPIVTENTAAHNAAITAAEIAYNAAETDDASALIFDMQNYRALDYNHVTETYTEAVELGEWTGKTNLGKGEHWSGDANQTYFDYSKWVPGHTNGANEATQKVTLPAGKYVLMAAGRAATVAGTEAYIKMNDDTKVNFAAKDAYGYGISTDGKANFAIPATDTPEGESTYARNDEGYGWEYRFIEFTLTEETEVTLVAGMTIDVNAAELSWASVCTPVLYTTPLDAAKNDLQTAIKNAENALSAYPVGEEAFQVSETSELYVALKNAIETAQNVLDNATTAEDLSQAIEPLNTAVNEYTNGYVLNAPKDGQRFYIKVATEGHGKLDNAILATLGGTSANNPTGYGLNANNTATGYLAQAFILTQVEGNLYNISIERPEGIVYLTYGSLNGSAAGWNKQQIQATTNAENKGEFKIEATAKEGVLKIFNTVDNNYLDCQPGGAIYTDTSISNEEFAFELAPEHEVTLSISSVGWATLILPFNADIPKGVVAYTSEGVADYGNGNAVQLIEAESFVANTPYLVSGEEGEYDFSGYGLAQQDSYKDGLFTGTYVKYQTTANSNTYVLQKHNDEVAFYLVGDLNGDGNYATPTVKPYRIYMTYEAPAGETAAPMFRIGRGATGIEDAEWTMDNGQWTIYDLMGRKVTTMEKGNMYIVNGKKVVIK